MPAPMNQTVRSPLNRLLRGVATDDVATIRDAWTALLAEGQSAVPAVREKLDSAAWAEAPKGPAARYLGVLLLLLDELDQTAFAEEIDRLLGGPLDVVHRHIVGLLAKRRGTEPLGRIGPGVPVFVAPDIGAPEVVLENLTCWSRTSGLDLDGLTRIDVIARRPEFDYLGRFDLRFNGIILTWPTTPAKGLWLALQRLDAEFTFYHEVGHFAHGHLEGGQVAEQEDEADAYAHRMIRAARPAVTGAPLAGILLGLRRAARHT